jgi:gamma-glutamylcyclotransferase (GGCT)/AIG2-like uncharacterized protein YtfP
VGARREAVGDGLSSQSVGVSLVTGGQSWWQEERFADDTQVALDHANEARRRDTAGIRGWELDACRDYFGSLNRMWSTLYQLSEHDESARPPEERSTEAVRLTTLLRKLEADQQTEFLARPSVRTFAEFKPSIFIHSAPGVGTHFLADVSDEARQHAAADHDAFKRGWMRWQASRARVPDVLRRLSRAVLVVRNNLAHGEKTRVGPDRGRTERNRAVAKVVLPVLEDMLDFVMDRPSHKFVAYGTLRPGQLNHSVINDIAGTWRPVTLPGRVDDKDGLPAFRYAGDSNTPAELLVSPGLPNNWRRLDEFERDRYERNLGLYRDNGVLGVGNVYIWHDPHGPLH